MVPTPGHQSLYTIAPTGVARGYLYSDLLKGCVFVIDDGVYFGSDSAHHRLFNIGTLNGRVYMVENHNPTKPDSKTGNPGGQLAVSDGEKLYIYSLDGTVKIAGGKTSSDPLPFKPGMIEFQDGYFFGVDLLTNQVYASSLNDGRSWPADSFSTVNSVTTGIAAFERMLFVFGEDVTEIFHDAALSPFPYAKDITRGSQYGCFSAGSLAKAINSN